MGWLYGSRAEMRASRGMLGRSGLISKPHDGLHASCRSRLMLAAVERTSRCSLLLRRTSLSRGLRTQPLPATLAPVGYRRGNNESHYPFRAETITGATSRRTRKNPNPDGTPRWAVDPRNHSQWRVALIGGEPITAAMPSLSITCKASASAALSVGNESSQTVELPNSSTTSSSHAPLPSP
jgi:hypothetical protein